MLVSELKLICHTRQGPSAILHPTQGYGRIFSGPNCLGLVLCSEISADSSTMPMAIADFYCGIEYFLNAHSCRRRRLLLHWTAKPSLLPSIPCCHGAYADHHCAPLLNIGHCCNSRKGRVPLYGAAFSTASCNCQLHIARDRSSRIPGSGQRLDSIDIRNQSATL